MTASYLTRDIPGIGGAMKRYPEDFHVVEIPLYVPVGEGQHTYIEFEKTGLTTFEAVQRIADRLGVSPFTVGYAGLKDSRAVTVQTISVESVPVEDVFSLDVPRVRVLSANYHRNKLRVGHLAGNRFRIRVREPLAGAAERAKLILDRLRVSGVPNLFGEQRFTMRRNAHHIGKAIVLGNWDAAVAEYLGSPLPEESSNVQEARSAFDAGNLDEARRLLPMPRYREERRLLGALLRGLPAEKAFREVNSRVRKLFVSAFQSAMFNRLLVKRMPDIGKLMDGDLAMKHLGGAVFHVSSAETEQPRADAFEISPSGPLFGREMIRPTGKPRELEDEILREEGFDPATMSEVFSHMLGQRRALRVSLMEAEVVEEPDGNLVVSFRLPSGSYATVVMDELMKTGGIRVFEEEDSDSEDRN